MIQAHKGYIETEAHLIADNSLSIKIPTDRVITILWEEFGETSTLARKQNEAIKQFRTDINQITDEPIDDEFRNMINNRITIENGVDL